MIPVPYKKPTDVLGKLDKAQRGDEIYSKKIIRQNWIMLYGSEPGFGVRADTKMVKEFADIFIHRYEKKFFTLLLPDVLNDMFSVDANMEMSASSTV